LATNVSVGSVKKIILLPSVEYITTPDAPGEAAWPVTNLALYIPFNLEGSATLTSIGLVIGGIGNLFDLGIYNESGVALYRSGGVARSASGFRTSTTSLALGRAIYYVGVSSNDVSSIIARANTTRLGSSAWCFDAIGIKQEASAYPLPATATFASPSNSYIPFVVLTLQVLD
jgi:hypothetical protein